MPNVKISFECQRDTAEIWEGLLASLDPEAVVGQEAVSLDQGQDLTSGDRVRLVAYLSEQVEPARLDGLAEIGAALTGESAQLAQEELPDVDWVSESQRGLALVQAGRVVVRSVEDHGPLAPNLVELRIEAANAFGTGHHGTTHGCLLSLLELLRRERVAEAKSMRLADIGCGTGVLAYAAAKLVKPGPKIVASDIDARAIVTARKNARANRVQQRTRFYVAPGVEHRQLRGGGQFDLVFANILSGLLVDMAPRLAPVVKSGGRLILSGLLVGHATTIERSYRALGFRIEGRHVQDDWVVLRLRKIRNVVPRTRQRGDQRFHPNRGGNWMHW